MSDLDCDHCGGWAFTSRDYDQERGVYLFTDGDGEACASCGYPGSVVADWSGCEDDDADIYWLCSDADEAQCNDPACETCEEYRALRDVAAECDETARGAG